MLLQLYYIGQIYGVEISQKFVAFSEYMNFNYNLSTSLEMDRTLNIVLVGWDWKNIVSSKKSPSQGHFIK